MKVDLKTAASITLLLQAVIPAVAISRARLEIDLTGGTDVPWSPTADYFLSVTLPAMERIGIRADLEVRRRGYYPAGGGNAIARIEPSTSLSPLELVDIGGMTPPALVSRCGRLPRHVAERQATAATSVLKEAGITTGEVSVFAEDSVSPGSSVLVSSVGERCFLGGDAIGARGKPAESVGRDAAQAFVKEVSTHSCLDSHIADSIVPLLALAESESRILVSSLTEHLRTSLHVASLFTGCRHATSPKGSAWLLTISPSKHNL